MSDYVEDAEITVTVTKDGHAHTFTSSSASLQVGRDYDKVVVLSLTAPHWVVAHEEH